MHLVAPGYLPCVPAQIRRFCTGTGPAPDARFADPFRPAHTASQHVANWLP